jgi:hypothetical protein
VTDRETINQQLEALGRVPIEPIEPRLDDLEAQLLAAIGDDGEHRLMPISGSPTTRGHRLLLVAAAVVCVLAIAGVLLVPKGSDNSIVIAAANDVSIVLPDGSAVVGSAGLELPDGTTIDVDGFVEVEGRRFGPGKYKVGDGELVVLWITRDTSTTVQSVVPAPSVSPGSTAPPLSTGVSATVRASDDNSVQTATTEVVRTAPPATRPASTRPTRASSTPIRQEPVRTVSTVPATTLRLRPTTTFPARTTTTSVVPTTAVRRVPTLDAAVPVRRGSA